MDAAPAVVAHRMSRLFDLPEDVFEQILLYLTLKEKVIARRVCKSWFQVVHHLLKLQTRVMLRVSLMEGCRKEDSGWTFETCGHSIGQGFSATLYYNFSRDLHGENIAERRPRDDESAVRGFGDAITFVTKHCDNIQIADLSYGFAPRHSLPIGWTMCRGDSVTDLGVLSACDRFVAKFQRQLQCLHCSMLTVTSDNRFPHLMHLTCSSISDEIRNVFAEITPKLTALDFDQVCLDLPKMNTENYNHLPKTFCSITMFPNFRLVDHADIVLQRCRNIHTIRLPYARARVGKGHHYPNLRSLRVHADRYPGCKRSITSATCSRLHRLEIDFIVRDMPDDLLFPELRSLIVNDCGGATRATDMLSRTTDNLRQLYMIVGDAADRAPILLTELSKLKSLTFLSMIYEKEIHADGEYDEEEVEAAMLRLLRGGSRSTLKFICISLSYTRVWSGGCRNPDICGEIDRMKEEESLTDAILTSGG